MGLANNCCGKCGKRGGLTKVTEFDGQNLPGSFCKKCGLFLADKQSEMFDVACNDCKTPMGYASGLVDVVHVRTTVGKDGKNIEEKTLIHKGEERKKYMCVDCSSKRVKDGTHNIDDVLTRYVANCELCGLLQAWIDAPESTENVSTNGLICPKCGPRHRELRANEKSIDTIVANVSSETSTPAPST